MSEQQRARKLKDIKQDHLNRYYLDNQILQDRNLTDSVLDAGCGNGYGSFILSDIVKQIHAVDIEPEVVEIFSTSYKKPNILFESGNILTTPLKKYDAIVCFEFIEHIERSDLAIQQFSKASNFLIISTPNEEYYPFKNHRYHERHYTPEQFKELLSLGGYIINEWFCQKGKDPTIVPGTDGRFMIAIATKK
jgi:2-polyprenyl-3-methyl-5-hydroxy-6-metoxy-1,4-benzoquinol methylase